ncbi:BolA family protein [Pseudogemmobacter humi]|uniref:Transcriptional regulator BolA n=1 Tax=Pseudogemmobacter humi TaxID=2483812 RepID=A0A3P5X810_9RHOB|nr:BolA family protein [Pseudogemmobacter humi]VDC30794.1 transcriptional regulator BolA [Pseudogemmobacter humi]
MAVSDEMAERLRAAFAPDELEIVNESGLHAGHGGDDGSGESHFRLRIRAPVFAPMSRVERHRTVIRALGDIPSRIHALALDIG